MRQTVLRSLIVTGVATGAKEGKQVETEIFFRLFGTDDLGITFGRIDRRFSVQRRTAVSEARLLGYQRVSLFLKKKKQTKCSDNFFSTFRYHLKNKIAAEKASK